MAWMKQTAIRVPENLLKIAANNIKIRSTLRGRKPEGFSAYMRNLIREDMLKNKKDIKNYIKRNS